MTLSEMRIRTAKPQAKAYKLSDSGGLFLFVSPTGSKLWRMKYRYLDKERLYSIGRYPIIGLSQARQKRDNAKQLLAAGIDPTQQRKSSKHQQIEAGQNTFEVVARRWFEVKKGEKEHKKRSLRRLELYVFSTLGFRPVQEITTVDVVDCLEKVGEKGILETAHRIKQLMQQVFRYAVRRGLITLNPAGDLRDVLAHPRKRHFARVRPGELHDLLQAMEGYSGEELTRLAMKLMTHTFVRTGELVGACWKEIDWARAEWRIPGERMKMKRPHIVPLSRQSLSILKKLKPITGKRDFIFFAAANKKKHLSNGAILGALRRMGYAGRMTGHGFRGLASTILNEQRKYHSDVIEVQLAHADRDEVRAAYNEAEYLLERTRMMQEWSDFLDGVLAGSTPILYGDFGRNGAEHRPGHMALAQ